MSKPHARPYGDCYEVSLQRAEELQFVKESVEGGLPNAAEVRNIYDGLGLHRAVSVVHGTAVPPDGLDRGRTILHAWVEVGDEVLEMSNNQSLRFQRDDYYDTHGIVPVVRYAPAEARRLAEKHGAFAPWHTLPAIESPPDKA